uniref:63 kDa sperm flagellar membrane protein n=1 Tax=Elaeophora elaphi TaxID=1147741 RepID=A0A0R3RLP1_9BILA
MPKDQKSTIPQSSGESADSPIWSVTRRQRTELSPRRDDETGATQSFSSRTVTTTERVQMIPVPVNFDLRMDVLTPIGKSERYLATTTITNESHNIPIIGGITLDGVPICTGLNVVPKTTKTKQVKTTMTSTTTTTYSVIEIDDSEEELKVETEEQTEPGSTQITLDFPLDYEVVDFEDVVAGSSTEEKKHVYVVVGKKDSPTRTADAADYIVKMIDIDLPSSESKDSPSIERISDAEIEGLSEAEEGYIDRHDYDAHEGTIASTSLTNEINQEPIHRYVTVYHNGVSSEKPDPEEERISKEISTVVAKLSGAYKRASIEGEHTVYTDARTGQTAHQEASTSWHMKESPRRLKSTYTVRFSDPFRIEADSCSWNRQQNSSEIIFQKAKKDQRQIADEPKREKELQTQTKRKDTTEETKQKKPIGAPKIITGRFKKSEPYQDYPATETCEGPVESTYRIP